MSAQAMQKTIGKSNDRGFTLIEIIITFVLIGFMAAMFSTFFTRAFTESSTPLVRLNEDVDLAAVMENMIADYKNAFSGNLSGFKTKVESNDATYGSYQIVAGQTGYVTFDASGDEQDDTGGTENILKVTIQSTSADNAQTLTYLFTE